MRKVLALIVGSLMLVGTLGCGGSDPARKPGFNKDAINPSSVKMPVTKADPKSMGQPPSAPSAPK